MIRPLLLVSGFVLMLSQQFFGAVSSTSQFVIFVIGVLVLGVPHGAADLLVATKNARESKHTKFSSIRFFATYLSRLVLFGLILFYFPITGNLLFILFAAYHFGETDLHQFNTDRFSGKLFVISYGLLILSVILLQHFEEVRPVFLQFESGVRASNTIDWIDVNRYWLMSGTAALFFLSCFFYFLNNTDAVAQASGRFLIQYSCILFILYHLPMLLGFTFYFVVWHSALSLGNIVRYLRNKNQFSSTTIGRQIVFYSMLALAGIGIFGAAGAMFADSASLTGYLFLGLAVLTAPHMQIMHDMYQQLRGNVSATVDCQPESKSVIGA